MSRSEAYRRSYRRCRIIGERLIGGPDGIGAPVRGRGGYFDPVLCVSSWPIRHVRGKLVRGNACSASVYVDDTNGRSDCFHQPLVRFAEWDRDYEARVRRVRRWPRVTVRQHLLTEAECADLDLLMRRLDEHLGQPGFIVGGLIRNRLPPPGSETETPFSGGFEIRRWNFCQKIELSSSFEVAATRDLEVAVGHVLGFAETTSAEAQVRYAEWFHDFQDQPAGTLTYRPPRGRR